MFMLIILNDNYFFNYFLLQKRKIFLGNFRYYFKFKQEYNGKYYIQIL